MSQIGNGSVVTLECQGTIPSPARFLDGLTASGEVKLSPATDGVFTGTHWQCSQNPDGNFTLACAGAVFGGRYLDGRTMDHTVGLAGDTLPPYSGTRWEVREVGPNIVTVKCLGSIEGDRFLDGLTAEGKVKLSPHTDQPFTGTKWLVKLTALPTLSVTTVRDLATGATLRLHGSGFTPGDDVRFAAEGLVGREHHAPYPIGGFLIARPDGSFEHEFAISFWANQPRDQPVVVRATDHHGISAMGVTYGFSA